jgi:hypothetical protein
VGALAVVGGERGRPLELPARLVGSAQPGEQVGADRGQQVVAAQRGVALEGIDDGEGPGRAVRAVRHCDGDGAVELDDRGRVEPAEGVVEPDDAAPVGVGGGGRPGVTGGELGLEGVRAWLVASASRARLRLGQGGQAVGDEQPVPARAILLEQRDRRAARAGPGGDAGRLDLHQRDQPVRLRLCRCQRREHPAQAHRLVAQLRPIPGLPRRRRVALVEDQVHDLEDGAEPVGQLRADRYLELDLRVREGLLRAGDPGCHRRRRDQERPRDLLG